MAMMMQEIRTSQHLGHASPELAQDTLYLYMRMQQLEKEVTELRKRNAQLEELMNSNDGQRIPETAQASTQTAEATTAPDYHSIPTHQPTTTTPPGSSWPLATEYPPQAPLVTPSVAQEQARVTELEKAVSFYKKKLEQSEELLYELQWDPSQDLLACREKNDTQTVEELQEKKIFQLLEQMRVMESGLQKKQQTIDSLNNEIRILRIGRVGSNPGSPSLNSLNSPGGAPRLQGIVVDEDPSIPSTPPQQPKGWLAYLTGGRVDKGQRIVNI